MGCRSPAFGSLSRLLRPSSEVTLCPSALEIGVMQERMGRPSSSTVHAPHCPSPQPNLAPLICKFSSRTYRSGVDGSSIVTLKFRPLTCSAYVAIKVSSQCVRFRGLYLAQHIVSIAREQALRACAP